MFDTLLWFVEMNEKIAVTDRKATNSIQLVAVVIAVVANATTDRGTHWNSVRAGVIVLMGWILVAGGVRYVCCYHQQLDVSSRANFFDW